MRRLLVMLLLLVAALFSFAVAQGSEDSVQIGVITSITGRFAEFGEQHQAGFAVALEDVNAAGGINGKPVEIVLKDDTSDVNAALAAAEELIGEVPIVLGAYSSSITNPLGQYFTREEFPFLVFTSSDDAITRPGSAWVFRLNQPATAYAEVLFDIFDHLNETQDAALETIAIIHGNGNFETAVSDAATSLAEERGYEIVERESYDRGITDFRPVLNRFVAAEPDIVLMVSYAEDSVGIMRQASEVNLSPDLFAGGAAGFALPGFVESGGEAANYVITATAWTKDVAYPGAQELYERLKEKLGGKEPSYHAAQAYAGIITAVDALKRAEDFSPESVQAALEATNLEETVYGPIRFSDQDGYQNQNPIAMIAQQVQNGEFVTVFPEAAAVGDIIFPTPTWDER